MPRAKQRTPELRAEVLRVAIATLEAEGASALTARRIAQEANTSLPAVYELFGDKAGVLREVFYEGFRMLAARYAALPVAADARAALVDTLQAIRMFCRAHRALAELMFSRPFAEFDPGPEERAAGVETREVIVTQVRRALDAGAIAGDATDIAHVLLAVVQGLALQETAGWLGGSRASIERRWNLAIDATLAGLTPARSGTKRTSSPRRART
ncbi:MAG: TetR/AcrR family transcriptional regulator [Polyangiales bacterium]